MLGTFDSNDKNPGCARVWMIATDGGTGKGLNIQKLSVMQGKNVTSAHVLNVSPLTYSRDGGPPGKGCLINAQTTDASEKRKPPGRFGIGWQVRYKIRNSSAPGRRPLS